VDPAKVSRALGVVKQGVVVPLGLPLDARAPVFGSRPRLVHAMLHDGGDYAAGSPALPGGFEYADDYIGMAVHTGTHIDALAHVARDGAMYNDVPGTDVRSSAGARRLGIENVGGVVTRALVADVAGLRGKPSLEAGEVVTVADLETCFGGLTVEPGDAVLVHTGWLARYRDGDPSWAAPQPGLGVEAAGWLADHDVCLVGCDNGQVEVWPAVDSDPFAVHMEMLVERGIYLMEYVNLGPLVAAGVGECLLVVAPLLLLGGIGSPVNPIAVY
jgi:kynurenine formamidase